MDGSSLVSEQYTRMAHVYEERVVPRFEPIARRTVELALLREGQSVLDVGCGTGLASLLAARSVGPKGEVVGVDFSEGQLGIALAKAQLASVSNVRFERRDATQMAFQGEFDAAISNLGIPADFGPTLQGMRRALKPEGKLSITEWERGLSEPFEAFNALLAERKAKDVAPDIAAGRAILAKRRENFARIGSIEGFSEAIRGAGFEDVNVVSQRYQVPFASARDAYDFVLSWGWQEQEVRLLSGPERHGLQEAMEKPLGSGPFTADWHLLHATATKPR